jgi:hypothetical protein
MTPTGVIANEHSRRFPRTLQEAFPVSEGYRESVEGPTEAERHSARMNRIIDGVCWAVFLLGVAWIGWQAWKASKVPW